jgi:hypothetical protein
MAAMELPQPPAGFARTRKSLHRLAEDVIKPAREQTSGGWTLTETPAGFGTPPFGEDCQVRVEGVELVVRERGTERRAPIGSLRSAAELIGPRLLPEGLGDLPSEELEIDPAAAAVLAVSYQLAREALEQLRREAGPSDSATEPTLWPEHFDLAIEMGEEGAGLRVNYGLSPGDENHDEPYFYVGPWTAPAAGGLWNATGFPGAELDYRELAAADDPIALAVDFALTRKRALELRKDPG